MKLVEDPMICHSTFVEKPDSKSFQYDDSTFVADGPKAGNKISKEDKNGIFCDLTDCKKEVDSLPFEINDADRLWETPDLDCYTSVNNLTNGNINKNELIRDSVAPCTISPNKAESLEDKGFYTDKSFTGCELPELIVCYKESYNHDVKDICVDEGVPSPDKILVEDGKDEPMGFCTFFSPNRDKDNDLITEKVDIKLPVEDELKSSEESSCNDDVLNQSNAEDYKNSDITNVDNDDKLHVSDGLQSLADTDCKKVIINESDTDDLINKGEKKNLEENKIASDVSTENVVPERLTLEQYLGRENSISKLAKIDENEVGPQSFQMLSGKAISTKPTLDSVAEESNISSFVDEFSYDSKVESGSITFNFDSSPATSSRVEGSQNADCEQPPPLEAPNRLRREDETASDHLRVSSRVHHDQGESSFSAVGPFSGLITYSGPIAYSGSLSLRSDSSTTSTRSFAFPVLQNEWNSSPIRMAKADRRRLRRSRGWRQGILCCRF